MEDFAYLAHYSSLFCADTISIIGLLSSSAIPATLLTISVFGCGSVTKLIAKLFASSIVR